MTPHTGGVVSGSPPQNYQEALRYIGRLPFDQAESNMKRYGKTLMHHVPDGTTSLLKDLCTDYQPKRESADRETPQREVKVSPAWIYRSLQPPCPVAFPPSLPPSLPLN